MSSFFIKKKPQKTKKRKHELPSVSQKNNKLKSKKDEEEIVSEEEINSGDEENIKTAIPSDDEYEETPQDKKLRLAKKYLEEIEKEELSRAEDKEINDHMSKRLRDEYLESVGKLRKNIAGHYKGYKDDSVKILKHKLQKLPLTVVIASNDNKCMFTGGKTAFVIKWDLETLKACGSINCQSVNEIDKSGKKRRPHVIAMALSTDMKFLAIAEGGNHIQIWCPIALKHLHTFKGHRDSVTCLVFRRDTHELYSGSKDRSVKIWSLDEMAYVESLFGHQSGVTGIDALSRERAVSSGGNDCSLRVWKITEESQLIYNGHRGNIESVKLINDENFLSCGDDGSLCLWSTLKKKPICTETLVHGVAENGEANWISSIATLVNTDLIASGSCDGYIRIWQMAEMGKKLLQLFQIPVPGFINSLAFSNNGSHLIAAVGQEHKLGRWWRNKDAKNGIYVIELDKTN